MTTPFVDVHAHFLTDRYVEAARAAGIDRPDGMPTWPVWSADANLRLLDRAGIGRAYLSVSSPGVSFGSDADARVVARLVNDEGAGIRAAHPDRFGQFASLPLPDVDGSLAEIAHALDTLGADGVTVMSNSRGVYLGDERLAPVWAELDRRGAVAFLHPTSPACGEELFLGRPRPLFEFIVETARTVSDLVLSGTAARFPGIRWIIPHGGGALPLLADRFELFRQLFSGPAPAAGPTIHEQLSRFWFDTAGTPFPRQVPALVDVVGDQRILYGSDSCWTPDQRVLAQVEEIDEAAQPAGTTWRDLTTANAERLFAR